MAEPEFKFSKSVIESQPQNYSADVAKKNNNITFGYVNYHRGSILVSFIKGHEIMQPSDAYSFSVLEAAKDLPPLFLFQNLLSR